MRDREREKSRKDKGKVGEREKETTDKITRQESSCVIHMCKCDIIN